MTQPKTKAADVERLGELCRGLRIDRETLRLHAVALATVAELETVVARRDEVDAENREAFEAEHELDRKITASLEVFERQRQAIRLRQGQSFAAAENVLTADRQLGCVTGHFAALFGRDPATVNQSAARAGLPPALKTAVAQLESRAVGKGGSR